MKALSLESVQEFMQMLTGGDLPDGMTMNYQPKLSVQSAFSVVWYLQEHLRIIPDNFELCAVCGELYDAHCDGHTLEEDGVNVCSMECEYDLLMSDDDEAVTE